MSAFRARGLVYLGARDYFEKHVPGGSEAIRGALPPETAAFWGQIFLGTAMYDALPIVAISAAAAELSGLKHQELVQRNAAWLAERDIQGVYKMLLNVVSAESVALRLPRAAIRYFDFGEADARMLSRGVCRAEQRAIPHPMATWFSACVAGFVPRALALAGARDPRVKCLATTEDGEKQGVKTITLSFEFTWS